jgi:hypothetical protein
MSAVSTEDLLVQRSDKMDAFMAAVDELGDLHPEAEELVKRLGCPWPWLVAELVDKFYVWTETLLYNLEVGIQDTIRQSPPGEVPSLAIEIRPGELVEECLERTRHEYVQWCADLIGPQGAKPRVRCTPSSRQK